MARIQRLVVNDEKADYHVVSRAAIGGLPLGDAEKSYFIDLIKDLHARYFVDVFGFCVMSTHFHILLEVTPAKDIPNKMIKKRFKAYYGDSRKWSNKDAPGYLAKWTSLPEYMKELRQRFTRFYNKRHNRRGTFWADKFKSLLLEKGRPLLCCLAYIDLNPVRAGVVDKPESYRWNSIGFRKRTLKKDDFLSFDIGAPELHVKSRKEMLRRYLDFLYDVAQLRFSNEELEELFAKSAAGEATPKDLDLETVRRFRKQHRFFQDSGILGSKEFVTKYYTRFKDYFYTTKEKVPKKISGLDGIFSMKKLSE